MVAISRLTTSTAVDNKQTIIELFVLDGFTLLEIHPKFKRFTGTLLLQFQPLKSGRLNLNVVVRRSKMIHVKDSQKLQPHRKQSKMAHYRVCEVIEAVVISEERRRNILHEELRMRNWARWVPHFLNVHHYTLETKQQSKQWVEAGGSVPKKEKSIVYAGKVMASVFWVVKGILAITGEYFSNLLDQLGVKIRKKRPGLRKKKLSFTMTTHMLTKVLTIGKLQDLRYDLFSHPPYSPDLAPSDSHLFPYLKEFVSGKCFTSNEEVERVVDEHFNRLLDFYFQEGILLLEKRSL
ncbi:hypothetical protein LAZ67_5001385 [Cordylochernes scorpioides]|uniref:Histone-lysine N-methyltransferase SETMAR n=1 Tax=Cordylochernes scorpioides TaxID=51811 RepID=A0ABY6KIN1_9ARAC|nr:hypothetical protein LAZ67_5001385 [Cordylochernes scorpioides]